MNDIFNLSNDPKTTFKMCVFVCQNSKNSPCKPLMVYPFYYMAIWEGSGSEVECLPRDRRATGSSLTGVTALWSLSKTHLS